MSALNVTILIEYGNYAINSGSISNQFSRGIIMGLEHTDFILSDKQLAEINNYSAEQGASYAKEGEGPAMSGLRVEFEWVPGLGRFITAYFDGATKGFAIESAIDL